MMAPVLKILKLEGIDYNYISTVRINNEWKTSY